MRLHRLSTRDWLKAIGIGIVVSLLLSAVMVPAAQMGISPMPKPLGLAFAQTILGGGQEQPAEGGQQEATDQAGAEGGGEGGGVPMPVGLLFHVVYVTFWSVAFVVLFRDRLNFARALGLALFLWVVVLVVFFPVVGWGLLGLQEGPMLILGSLVPHLLFAVFLWAGCRLAFGQATTGTAAR